MAVIDTLTVNLQAATAGLTKGLTQGQTAVKGFASSVSKDLAFIGGAIGGAFSIKAIGDFVLGGIDAADTLADLAVELNTTAEALNRLRHAAVMSDVESDLLVAGLERMQRTIGDAKLGSKDAATALDRLNVKMFHLGKMDVAEQFKTIAEAISRVKDPTTRAALAVDIFGKSGQKLIPVLMQGEAGINKLGEEVAGMFSPENVKAIGEADDAIKNLKESFVELEHAIAVRTAPAVAAAARDLADTIRHPQKNVTGPIASIWRQLTSVQWPGPRRFDEAAPVGGNVNTRETVALLKQVVEGIKSMTSAIGDAISGTAELE